MGFGTYAAFLRVRQVVVPVAAAQGVEGRDRSGEGFNPHFRGAWSSWEGRDDFLRNYSGRVSPSSSMR